MEYAGLAHSSAVIYFGSITDTDTGTDTDTLTLTLTLTKIGSSDKHSPRPDKLPSSRGNAPLRL
jgi:hypothetical protein